MAGDRVRGFFDFINRRIGRVAAALVLLAVALGIVGPLLANDEEVNFSPSGSIYDTADRAEDVFASSSAIDSALFIVEHPEGDDVLTRDFLLMWKQRSDRLRAATDVVLDRPLSDRLVTGVDLDLGIEIEGVYSIADAVDDHLAAGLEGATEGDVKLALSELLAADSATVNLRGMLSQHRTQEPAVVGGQSMEGWRAPAFFAQLRYDGSFGAPGATEEQETLDAEAWLIEVQTVLQRDRRPDPTGSIAAAPVDSSYRDDQLRC